MLVVDWSLGLSEEGSLLLESDKLSPSNFKEIILLEARPTLLGSRESKLTNSPRWMRWIIVNGTAGSARFASFE